MSQENVELAGEYLKAYNSHGLDGTEHLRHAEIELHDLRAFQTGTGTSAKRRFARRAGHAICVHIDLFEAGKLRRMRQYLTRGAGLEAVGLRE
jgi:hypothetical protein